MTQFDVLNKIIDSRDFTVGGGSAAALAGAMAAGLIGMVARLSIKKGYGLSKEEYTSIADKADKLSSELLEGTVKDTESFKKIKEAYAMPKETEDDKSARSLAVEKAAVGAATVPLYNGKICKWVFDLGVLLKDKSNPNAASDLEEGNLLVNAAILGCVLNIEANLPLIKDENIKEKFQQEINYLKQYSNNI
ncbi:cyclodeaminase/cyclohydrolase family protein [Clostridium lundense]|uniref:cyclodeaminase/cyclohydrolase family protein n=1 Tax=Clostridium lundense TaxID=319475 RepID=UPI000489C794|nr:cyclodeaminase/cyclohydrolase family protein [Clostridium lundense]